MFVIEQHSGSCRGYAIGQAWIYERQTYVSSGIVVSEAERAAQYARYMLAVANVKDKLSADARDSEIFAAHLELSQDPMLHDGVQDKIELQGLRAEDALDATCNEIVEMMLQIDDEYLRVRATDIRDVCGRIMSELVGESANPFADVPDGSVIFADELTPSEMSQVDLHRVRGFVTQQGSATGHVCIMARNVGLTAVVGVGEQMSQVKCGDRVIVDGYLGKVIVNPTEEVEQQYSNRVKAVAEERAAFSAVANAQVATSDAHPVSVWANAGSVDDVARAMAEGADGIGLFRSEFVYMQSRDNFPDEQTQYAVYKEAAEACGQKPLIIRTLDIGGDKSLPYYDFPHEENPFLGWRAIRVSLSMRDMFKVQLRAILRAGACGNVRVMLPMIISLDELTQTKQLIEECKAELRAERVPFDEGMKVGVMIETPAAVMIADVLAAECDFFSIGTNDLTQYVLAVDRTNSRLSQMYDPLTPAVVRSVQAVVEAAHKSGCEVGMCGEFASDTDHTELLIGLGLDELSVSPMSVAQVKAKIVELSYAAAKSTAQSVVTAKTATEIRRVLKI